MLRAIAFCLMAFAVPAQAETAADERTALDALIERHANANGVPVAFVRHVIRRESNFNPRVVDHGNYGLMQIRLGTAHALGYRGTAAACRSGCQHDLRNALSCRRLSRRPRQRSARDRALFARLLAP